MGDKSRFSSPLTNRAKELRGKATLAERYAWGVLRNRRTLGLKFRRQVSIDDFIVDFYCEELRLVVEIDGDVHGDRANPMRDERRNSRLKELGFTILRIPNGMAIKDPDGLINLIRSLRPSPGPSGFPLPGGEGR